ncbi:MAG: hypothetical protein ABIT83_10860 [Massilia sp.]
MLAKLLTHWALRSTLDTSYLCAGATRRGQLAGVSWRHLEHRLTFH